MRLLICAGGTGGGVYPALAVLQAITDISMDDVLWIGSDDGMEAALVQRAGVNFRGIPSAGLHGVNLFSLPGRFIKLFKGYLTSRRILKEFTPDVLFFTGGYVGFPMAAAGRSLPSVLFVPDIEPGMALDKLSKSASIITLVCDDSRKFFSAAKRIEVTGYPTRSDMKQWEHSAALKVFDLSGERPIIFVFGGSKGARSINRALAANLPDLLPHCQIIHVTGQLDWEEVQSFKNSLSPELAKNYRIYPYLHENMSAAFSLADLVISRAGASTLGEFPLFGVPAILVPYPYAWRYQKTNAEYLTSKGAAIMIKDQDLATEMSTSILDLINDRAKLTSMKNNMAALATPHAAETIAHLLDELSQGKK